MTSSLDQFASSKLDRLSRSGLRRTLSETYRIDGVRAERDGRVLTSFCCNDYLNLSQDPRVKDAAVRAIEAYGAGAGASRLVTGNHPLYRALEERIADFKGADACSVFGSGYLANIGIPPALAGEDDLVLIDALSHASMHAGARLTGARVVRFEHNDLDHCRAVLLAERASHPRCLIMTEGVFSMDGDRAPLEPLAALAREFDAWLMCDDAHGFGVLGGGRGTANDADPPVDIPLAMGTLSKAIGAYGGYLCASAPVIDLLRSRVRSFVYSTGLPPAVLASALAAFDVIESDPERVARPLENARLFTREFGLPAPQSQIVPLIVGDADEAMRASEALEEQGFLVTAIRPPTVPDGTARLRLTFTAGHTSADVVRLAASIRDVGLEG